MNFIKEIFKNKNSNKIAIQLDDESITYSDLIEKSDSAAKYLLDSYGNFDLVCLSNEKTISNVSILLACLRLQKCFYFGQISDFKNSDFKIVCTEHLKLNYFSKTRLPQKFNLANNKLAYIIQTSGTTSRPKKIPITYNNFNTYFNNAIQKKIYLKNDYLLHISDFTFDVAISDLLMSLAVGAKIFLLPTKEIYKAPFVIQEHKINTWSSTPYLAYSILLNETKQYFKTIKKVIHCGEKFSVDLYQKWKKVNNDIEVINLYGPAEATVAISIFKTKNLNKKQTSEEALPIGRFFKNLKFEINKCNELVISGPQVFKGYLGQSRVEKFNTRDIIYKRHSYFYFGGRTDNQIKIKGIRIQLEDLEFDVKNILNTQNVFLNFKNEIININLLENEKAVLQKKTQALSKLFQNQTYKILYLRNFLKTKSGKLKKSTI